MLNVYEQVDRNKRRSVIVIVAFFAFVLSIGWLFTRVLGFGPDALVAAFIFAIVSSFTGYWWGDKIILASTGARPADKKRDFNFFTVAENLSLVAGMPKLNLYVIDDSSPNAFATGRDPQHATICATTGLLEKLDRTELEGVVAHEISHIQGFDTRLMTIVGVLVGMILLLSDWFLRGAIFRRRDDRDREGNQLQSLLFFLGIFAIILSPIIAQLIQLAISRRREFLADAQGVKLTRFPDGLARALEKISRDSLPLKQASGATAHLFIVNPFKKGKVSSFVSNLFATHPPVEERIRILRQMT